MSSPLYGCCQFMQQLQKLILLINLFTYSVFQSQNQLLSSYLSQLVTYPRQFRFSACTSLLAHSKSNVSSLQILLDNPLALLNVPRGLSNAQIYAVHCYKAAVSKVNRNPKQFTNSMECAVCNQKHSLNKCKWLNDIDFLKKFRIQFCLLMRQMSKATTKAAVNSIDKIPEEDAMNDDLSTYNADAKSDFSIRGRINSISLNHIVEHPGGNPGPTNRLFNDWFSFELLPKQSIRALSNHHADLQQQLAVPANLNPCVVNCCYNLPDWMCSVNKVNLNAVDVAPIIWCASSNTHFCNDKDVVPDSIPPPNPLPHSRVEQPVQKC